MTGRFGLNLCVNGISHKLIPLARSILRCVHVQELGCFADVKKGRIFSGGKSTSSINSVEVSMFCWYFELHPHIVIENHSKDLFRLMVVHLNVTYPFWLPQSTALVIHPDLPCTLQGERYRQPVRAAV